MTIKQRALWYTMASFLIVSGFATLIIFYPMLIFFALLVILFWSVYNFFVSHLSYREKR